MASINTSISHIEISKPLRDVHIISTKTSDAQSTCVFHFHHSIGDGTSLINLLLASSRKALDPEALPTLHGKKVSSPHIRATIVRSQFIVLWNSLMAVVMFILTGFVSLDDIKMVKNAMDVTVNDVLVGVLEAGLYRYLNRRYGSSPDIVYYRKRSRSDKVLLIQSFSTSSDTTCEVPMKRIFFSLLKLS
ncbi:hypothetical protein Tco_1052227 [Tanacetum coccineum]